MRRWRCGILVVLSLGSLGSGPGTSTSDTPAPGLQWAAPPPRLALAPEPEPSLELLRHQLASSDPVAALRTASRLTEQLPPGRRRDAVQMVIGTLHREAGRQNLASEAFTQVRLADGPLAPWGAYHEAEQDYLRGRRGVAIQECERYRERWPTGEHAEACLRLMARSHAELGHAAAARGIARSYDEDHPRAPISEQVDLSLALAALQGGDPQRAVQLLTELAVTHAAPLTGRVAEERLAQLRAEGQPAEIPDTLDDRIQRALSLRDARRRDDAWALFEELVQLSADDPDLTAFVEDEAERFGWRTHQWDFLADWYGAQYAAEGHPRSAWSRYRVMSRAGRHQAAADYALQMQAKHGSTREWRRSHEDVGRTMLLAGRYLDARTQFDQVAAGGGWTGRRGTFFAAFSSLMGGDLQQAVARFSAIITQDRSWLVESRYWRARALELLERSDEAERDRRWVLEQDPTSWYAVLIRQTQEGTPQRAPLARSGSWVGAPPNEPPPEVALPQPPPRWEAPLLDDTTPTIPIAALTKLAPRAPTTGLSALPWPWSSSSSIPEPLPPAGEPKPERAPPSSYRDGALWQAEAGRSALDRFTARYGRYWPELLAIHDLALVGLYDLSGPLMSQWYESWRSDYRRGRNPARKVRRVTAEDWRTLFLAAHDHHHAARFTNSLWEEQTDPELRQEAARLTFPLAHDQVVWAASREHNVDPFLVLGLMRQESTYNATAVSRVGARGAMQIMPRTGHLLADLKGNTAFTAGDLEDPVLSIRYGITYLGLLMERFDGAFPLAVASYNGGPFNVSTWLRGTGVELPMDAFIEHIPFRETRDYVKRVTSGYAAYVELYGPSGSQVLIPPNPLGDHPEIVDF
ncbi:MAG TPA: lytic transglycosylase domain-containing protein [Deltaproteobacteria bacterium]|nr:lytic transglycosylase domain-containing protein [Deltaproteobacteria bacterium]